MASYILLVDDNSDLSDNLKLILELEGLRVRVASSGGDALQAIKEELPGLIVADVVMPGTNGYDLFREVKAIPSCASIPFIFLSALTTAEDINRGLKMGADAYITKPFVITDLLTTIRRYLQYSTNIY
jgi:two-component system alkaline phosphatase synthesis response regulator PhoP